ncbi:MAG: tetratricopeptide repeat protein, partial [Synergistaceae bacterium]|nr:tetratricopeptide repeat protein [Synergistaceae bacterium]
GDRNLIRRGDGIEPISSEKAKQLTSGKKFAKSRPKESSDAFESLFGKDDNVASVPPQDQLPLSNSGSKSELGPTAPKSAAPKPTIADQGGAPARLSPTLASNRPVENASTDPVKVISTYGLPPGEANIRRIAHINARKLSGQKAYGQYVELVDSYNGDYLAAYQAGQLAQQLKKNDDAKAWYDKALQINPGYRPAQDARQKIE